MDAHRSSDRPTAVGAVRLESRGLPSPIAAEEILASTQPVLVGDGRRRSADTARLGDGEALRRMRSTLGVAKRRVEEVENAAEGGGDLYLEAISAGEGVGDLYLEVTSLLRGLLRAAAAGTGDAEDGEEELLLLSSRS